MFLVLENFLEILLSMRYIEAIIMLHTFKSLAVFNGSTSQDRKGTIGRDELPIIWIWS